MYMFIFSHTYYSSYKPLPSTLGFCSSLEFSFFPFIFDFFYSFQFFIVLIFKTYFSTFIPWFPFPLFLSCCSLTLMYANLVHLPLFNSAYLSFLFFPFLSIFCQFYFRWFHPHLLQFCFPVCALVTFIFNSQIYARVQPQQDAGVPSG